MSVSTVRFQKMDAPFGVEVLGLDARETLPDLVRRDLVQAWREHSLLLIRRQELEPATQVEFTKIFGAIDYDEYSPEGFTYIANVGERAYLPHGELLFHSDHAMASEMPEGTILYGIETPPPGLGGETLFSNAALAYQKLPDALRARIAHLKVCHTRRHSDVDRLTESGIEHSEKDRGDDLRRFERPLALRHPTTGASLLFLCPRFSPYIPGLSREESASLVAELLTYVEDPGVIYQHTWRPGDAIVWDNIALQHARTDWDSKYRRNLRRVVFGVVPANDAAVPA